MALDSDWDRADKDLESLERHPSLHLTLVAMRRLVELLRHEPTLGGIQCTVSLASLVLAPRPAARRVCVSWDESEEKYKVQFVDPPLEFSELTTARERDVLRVIRQYLNRIGELSSIERRERILGALSHSSVPVESWFIASEAVWLIISFGPDVLDELESIVLSHAEGDSGALLLEAKLAIAYLVLTGVHAPQRGVDFLSARSERVQELALKAAPSVFGPWESGNPRGFSIPLGPEFREFVRSRQSSPSAEVSRLATRLWTLWNPS